MQVTLPYTKHKVTLEDFIPEEVVEVVDQVLLSKMRIDDMSWERVTIDQVAATLPDDYDKYLREKDDAKKMKLLDNAKKRVAVTDPNRNGISGADFKESNRLKVTYMITDVKLTGDKDGKTEISQGMLNDKDMMLRWLKRLPSIDFDFLLTKVGEIEKKMDSFLKTTGAA